MQMAKARSFSIAWSRTVELVELGGLSNLFIHGRLSGPASGGRGIRSIVRCHALNWLRANGVVRACTFVRGDNPASLRAVRRWQQPAGTFRYIKFRGFNPWVMGKPAPSLPPLVPADN